jgi:hypothetical protein
MHNPSPALKRDWITVKIEASYIGYHVASYMGWRKCISYEMLHPVLDAFRLNKYSIWEDHRFTRAREPVNK